ncbi:MAG: DUF427 domain-containing protein [Stellaceae bacterium]
MANEKSQSGFKTNPDYRILFEPSPRRVRVKFNGEIVADSTEAHLLFETRHLPVYYFPQSDLHTELLTPTAHHTFCPYKGKASYWSVSVNGKVAENAVWSYLDPFEEVAAIKGFAAFYWNRMDAWYEEDDEVFVHPRDPYKRVDVLNSSRHVRVVLDGQTVAETRGARFLFETRLPTRYYIPAEDVRGEFLLPSAKVTACPYKGTAHYYSVRIGDKLFEDIVWSYSEPIPECPKIKGYLCFFHEQVDVVEVDGVAVPRPVTPWSTDWREKAASLPDPMGPRASALRRCVVSFKDQWDQLGDYR